MASSMASKRLLFQVGPNVHRPALRPLPHGVASRKVLRAPRALDYRAEVGPWGNSIIEGQRKHTVELFYTEAWANSTPELLPSLCNGGVTYCDVRGDGSDTFGFRGLTDMIEECCASHPLLRIHVNDVFVDSSGDSCLVDWHATAAHLLPGRSGAAPTGLVSEVCGVDQVTFGDDGRITSILSFRDRFAEESAAIQEAGGAATGAAE